MIWSSSNAFEKLGVEDETENMVQSRLPTEMNIAVTIATNIETLKAMVKEALLN